LMTTSVTSSASSPRSGCRNVSTAEYARAASGWLIDTSAGCGESIHIPEVQITCDEDVDVRALRLGQRRRDVDRVLDDDRRGIVGGVRGVVEGEAGVVGAAAVLHGRRGQIS